MHMLQVYFVSFIQFYLFYYMSFENIWKEQYKVTNTYVQVSNKPSALFNHEKA